MTESRGYLPLDAPPHETPACGRERMDAGLDACRFPAACACEASLVVQRETEARAVWPPPGVTPYYADDAVCIILGDAREIVPRLACDVLISDPASSQFQATPSSILSGVRVARRVQRKTLGVAPS